MLPLHMALLDDEINFIIDKIKFNFIMTNDLMLGSLSDPLKYVEYLDLKNESTSIV